MRLIERPEWAPHSCAVTLRDTDPDGFIDTGMNLPLVDPRIYVSVEGVRSCLRVLGWPTREEFEALEAEHSVLRQRCADLEADLKEADSQINAVAVLRQNGFRAERKRGPKPKATV